MKRATSVEALALVEQLEADPKLAARYARVLAPHVFGIACQNVSRPAETYSSRKGCGAPGLSGEENKRIARIIGRRRGRWWTYTADELDAYERGQKTSAPAPSKAWSPEDAAAQAGLRVVGGRS